ncbi:MAG: hypothetical protein AB1489_27395 [Acidobacteriota bacterium]
MAEQWRTTIFGNVTVLWCPDETNNEFQVKLFIVDKPFREFLLNSDQSNYSFTNQPEQYNNYSVSGKLHFTFDRNANPELVISLTYGSMGEPPQSITYLTLYPDAQDLPITSPP